MIHNAHYLNQRLLRLASLAGSRFNALWTHEWEERPGTWQICPASHSRVTHLGARVAPQRCPILRVSRVTVIDDIKFSKNKITATRKVPQSRLLLKLLNFTLLLS